MTRIIVATMPNSPFLPYLLDRLPSLEVVEDIDRNAWHTYMRTIEVQDADPAIHLEDDIILTKDFAAKAEKVIELAPRSVIQFFSMRGKDKTEGSRWSSDFAMNQCTYIPAGHAPQFLRFADSWRRRREHPTGYDLCMHDWLRSRKEPFWISVPSLVQHRVAPSRISSRRSQGRQSLTFTDGDGE